MIDVKRLATVGRFLPPVNRFFPKETRGLRLLQLAGISGFLVFWQAVGESAPHFYSSPTRVAAEISKLIADGRLIPLVLVSFWALLIGLAIALVLGVSIGMLMGRYRAVQVALDPYLAAYYSVPRVAFVPLMVIWFGINREFVIASVVFAAMVLLLFATAAGVREAGHAYYELARTFKLSQRQEFTKILLPGAVPFIATGMRLAAQRALVAVIVAEFLVGMEGIGLMLREARVILLTDRLFATAIVTMFMGIAVVAVTSMVERRLSSWRPQVF